MDEDAFEPDRKVVEVLKDGERIAVIYPAEKGIRMVSKRFPYIPENPEKVKEVIDIDCNEFPTAILINLIRR